MTRREQGVMTVHAMTVTVVLMLVAVIAAVAVAAYGLGQRAGQAADLAALAASRASVEGDDPCNIGRAIADANEAELVACRMDADVATVKARAELPRWLGHWGMEREARAAPEFYFE